MTSERPDHIRQALRRGFVAMTRGGLRGVWIRGQIPDGAFVWAASHHGWWDPFVASVLLDRPCLLMRQDNLERFEFVRHLGVFGTAEPRLGLDYLAGGRPLVIYPEGELRAPGPLGDLSDGAAWYARRAGVPLYAVAIRVLMRAHQAPEAYVSLHPVDTSGAVPTVTRRLADCLSTQLDQIDGLVSTSAPDQPLPGFVETVHGRRSWDERITTMGRWRPWAR